MTAIRGYLIVFGLFFMTTLGAGFMIWDSILPHGLFVNQGFMICLFLAADFMWLVLFWLVRVNDVYNHYGERKDA